MMNSREVSSTVDSTCDREMENSEHGCEDGTPARSLVSEAVDEPDSSTGEPIVAEPDDEQPETKNAESVEECASQEVVSTTDNSSQPAEMMRAPCDAGLRLILPKKKQILCDFLGSSETTTDSSAAGAPVLDAGSQSVATSFDTESQQPVTDAALAQSPAKPTVSSAQSPAPSPASLDSGFKLKSRWLTQLDDTSENQESTQQQQSALSNLTLDTTVSSVGTSAADTSVASDPLFDDSVDPDNRSTWPPVPEYESLTENVFKVQRQRGKTRKEKGRMLCDCTWTPDDTLSGKVACGAECINRNLYIECGSKCECYNFCTNKRFQNMEYAEVEPFPAGKKGWGLRARQFIPKGTFIMEYVAEVLSGGQFKERLSEYARDGRERHAFFMALSSNEIMDSTLKGNATRFINHSCEPNAETQKWTVNGYLRIGFFALSDIRPLEEITFDYRYQRFGSKPERCYCESSNCRGYIGGDGDNLFELMSTPEKEEGGAQQLGTIPAQISPVLRVSDGVKQKLSFRDLQLEQQIASLVGGSSSSGSAGQQADSGNGQEGQGRASLDVSHVAECARLMIRADEAPLRHRLLDLIEHASEECLTALTKEAQLLHILHQWLIEEEKSVAPIQRFLLRFRILRLLEEVPVAKKHVVKESRLDQLVNVWLVEGAETPHDTTPGGETVEDLIKLASSGNLGEIPDRTDESRIQLIKAEIVAVCQRLVVKWEKLKEVYKIPKKTNRAPQYQPAGGGGGQTSSSGLVSSDATTESDNASSTNCCGAARDERRGSYSSRTGSGYDSDSYRSGPESSRRSGGSGFDDRDPRSAAAAVREPRAATSRRDDELPGNSNSYRPDLKGRYDNAPPWSRTHQRRGSSERNPGHGPGPSCHPYHGGSSAAPRSSRYYSRSPESTGGGGDGKAKRGLGGEGVMMTDEWEMERHYRQTPSVERPPNVEDRRREFAEQQDIYAKEFEELQETVQKELIEQSETVQLPIFPVRKSRFSSVPLPAGHPPFDDAAALASSLPGSVAPPPTTSATMPTARVTGTKFRFSVVQAPAPPPSCLATRLAPPVLGVPRPPAPDAPPAAPQHLTHSGPYPVTSSSAYSLPPSGAPGGPATPGHPPAYPGYAAPSAPQQTHATAYPAFLVFDPNTGEHWWQDSASKTLVYMASKEQVKKYTAGDLSVVPYFLFDAVHQLIREVCLSSANQQVAAHANSQAYRYGLTTTQQSSQQQPGTGAPPLGLGPQAPHLGGPQAPHLGAASGWFPVAPPAPGPPQTTGQQVVQPGGGPGPGPGSGSGPGSGCYGDEAEADRVAMLTQQVELLQRQLKEQQEKNSGKTQGSPTVSRASALASGSEKSDADLKLPPNWRCATDDDGDTYYYHVITKKTQWEHPGRTNPGTEEPTDVGPPEKKSRTAPADTSSEVDEKRRREEFKHKLANVVMKHLHPYQRPECRAGRITSHEDFKYLARKLTHQIFDKERKRLESDKDLKFGDPVAQRAKEHVRKTMSRCGHEFRRSSG